MKTKTTKQLNKSKKRLALARRYAGLISARMALKAGEHKMMKGVRLCG